MSQVPFLSALYVNAPPIPQQKLFKNNVTTWIVNFSEYLFSVPCKNPSYIASLNLNLSEVPSSALKKIALVALWAIVVVFAQSLWKVAAILVCVKLLNRTGFAEPPKELSQRRDLSPRNGSPYSPRELTPFMPKQKEEQRGKAPKVKLPFRENKPFLSQPLSLGLSFVVVDDVPNSSTDGSGLLV